MERISISKKELINLIAASEELEALECGGVDNWSYYYESKADYLEQAKAEDFEELAEKMLEEKLKNKAYERVEAVPCKIGNLPSTQTAKSAKKPAKGKKKTTK